MQEQTFINQMTARGYELETVGNSNINATKDDTTVRLLPLADYVIYIDTPTVSAIIRKDTTDDEILRIIDGLTA